MMVLTAAGILMTLMVIVPTLTLWLSEDVVFKGGCACPVRELSRGYTVALRAEVHLFLPSGDCPINYRTSARFTVTAQYKFRNVLDLLNLDYDYDGEISQPVAGDTGCGMEYKQAGSNLWTLCSLKSCSFVITGTGTGDEPDLSVRVTCPAIVDIPICPLVIAHQRENLLSVLRNIPIVEEEPREGSCRLIQETIRPETRLLLLDRDRRTWGRCSGGSCCHATDRVTLPVVHPESRAMILQFYSAKKCVDHCRHRPAAKTKKKKNKKNPPQ